MLRSESYNHWLFLREVTDAVSSGTLLVYGLVLGASGWKTSPKTCTPQGKKILQSALIVASTLLHLDHCVGIRCFKKLPKLPAMDGISEAETLLWQPDMYAEEFPQQFNPGTGEVSLQAKSLALEHLEECESSKTWHTVCVISTLR